MEPELACKAVIDQDKYIQLIQDSEELGRMRKQFGRLKKDDDGEKKVSEVADQSGAGSGAALQAVEGQEKCFEPIKQKNNKVIVKEIITKPLEIARVTGQDINPSRLKKDSYENEEEIVSWVNSRYRQNARKFLIDLKSYPDLGYNEKTGWAIIDGAEIPGSNIGQLTARIFHGQSPVAYEPLWINAIKQKKNLAETYLKNPKHLGLTREAKPAAILTSHDNEKFHKECLAKTNQPWWKLTVSMSQQAIEDAPVILLGEQRGGATDEAGDDSEKKILPNDEAKKNVSVEQDQVGGSRVDGSDIDVFENYRKNEK